MSLGTDFECADDITSDWRVAESEGDAYVQALYRRLTVSRLFYSVDDYGLPVEYYLADTVTQAQMNQEIERECLKDERTRSVRVTWENNVASIEATTHNQDTFTLTLDLNAKDIASALSLPEESGTIPGQE